MKNFKRIFSGLLAATVLTGTLSFGMSVGAAEEVADTAAAVSPFSAGQEGLLRQLELITEEAPNYDAPVTRGQLAYIAVRTSNLAEYEGEERFFYDVDAENPYYGAINALLTAKVVSGDGDGFYRPDDPATELELCKIFSVILGYKDVGYFDTYFKTARSAGLLDGIEADGVTTYGEALVVAWNTLHAEMFEPIAYGDEVDYKVQDDFLAIERYHNMVQQKGIVTGVCGTTLTEATEKITQGKIQIGGRLFNYADDSVLGKAVVFYSGRDRDTGLSDKNITYLYVDEEENNMLTIPAEDIIGLDGTDFKYFSNDREKSLVMKGSVDVIYNGIAHPLYKAEDVKPKSGSVTFIDNDDDSVYEVAVVESYQFLKVKSVDKVNEIIICEDPADETKTITMGSKDGESIFTVINARGMEAKFSTVKQGNILAVKASKNTTGIAKYWMTSLKVSATDAVQSKTDDQIVIGENSYTITPATLIDSEIRLGQTIGVYLFNGEVGALIHGSNTEYQFAYLVNADKKDVSFSKKLLLQIIDNNRVKREFEVSDYLMFNEKKEKDMGAVLDSLLATAKQTYNHKDDLWPYSQPVRFRVNDEGKLTHLDTLYYDSTIEGEDSLRLDVSATSAIWSYYNSVMYSATTNAMLFTSPAMTSSMIVPKDNRDEEEWYENALGDAYTGYVEGYTIDPVSQVAEYMILYINKATTFANAAAAYVVAEINTVLDEEGMACRQVVLQGTGGKETRTLANTCETELGVGDVIRYRTDQFGKKIHYVDLLFDMSKGAANTQIVTRGGNEGYTFSARHRIAFGTPLSIAGSTLTHTTSMSTKYGGSGIEAKADLNNYTLNGSPVLVYDTEQANPAITVGSSSDIVTYEQDRDTSSRVVIYTQKGNVRWILLIK